MAGFSGKQLSLPVIALTGNREKRNVHLKQLLVGMPVQILQQTCYVHIAQGTIRSEADLICAASSIARIELQEGASWAQIEEMLLVLSARFQLAVLDVDQRILDQYCDNGADSLFLCNQEESSRQARVSNTHILHFLDNYLAATPVWACILIGGKSSRMGEPKHLLPHRKNTTWFEQIYATVRPLVSEVCVAGAGLLPPNMDHCIRLPDCPGISGPLAGILAALRFHPHVSWLVVACDMPEIQQEAIEWLLHQRNVGDRAVLPKRKTESLPEPLFAWYHKSSRNFLEMMGSNGIFRMREIASFSLVRQPLIPDHLAVSWTNINSFKEIEENREKEGGL